MSTRPHSERYDLFLCIGGLVGHVELLGAKRPFLEQVLARYEPFEMPPVPEAQCDFSLRLEMRSAPPPGTRDVVGEAEACPLEVKATERTIAVKRWDLRVRLVARDHGRRLTHAGRGHCEMNPFAVDCILRVLWSTLLPRHGGMLVHGCGLRHGDVAVVFPGESGAGKTTLARKAPDPDDVLSDELCVIRRANDGWRVHGTPFWGDFARGGVSMRSWPLRALAFLAQAPRDVVTMTPIVSAEATFRLLGCFLSFPSDRKTIARNVNLAIQLASETRAVEASLTKHVPAPAIFRKLVAHLGPDADRKAPPENRRELISDFRSLLRKQRSYTFQEGGARRLGAPSAGAITVTKAAETDLAPDDIGLYWRPGRTPNGDTVVACSRIRSSRGRHPRRSSDRGPEFLGKVDVRGEHENVRPDPLPQRIGDLSGLFGSLVASPESRATRRL